MNRFYYLLGGFALGLAVLAILASTTSDGSRKIEESGTSNGALRKLGEDPSLVRNYAVKIPEGLNFAGEKVPLSDEEVFERMDRELLVNSYWHSNTMQNLKLAHRWFPVIEETFKEYGIPSDFKYIALAESGLRNVVSPAGAEGVWQFLPETARHFDLRVDDEVDERYDVQKATVAAAKYFQTAHDRLGSWTLAAASYNAGIGKIENSLEYQEVDNYYDLFLNNETSRYIFRILAFKVIYENTEKYGFLLDEEDLYDPLTYKTITVDTTITNLAAFATRLNTNYKTLKYYNPWLRDRKLTVKKGEEFRLYVPEDGVSN
ncbi:MAG: lytic transglycosylase domain-containing protein [Chitinophagales bacterium]|nr:lytic transglycosylase domain-containing protein [Chitinophagales bacterium]MCB9021528.1 lytic transglycosylase domain-containing protein [Chitinophagales bacterium]